MEQILDTFHVDGTLLVAQLINFLIVFIILYVFVSKPLTVLMTERSQKIQAGLENAKHFEEKILALHEERDLVLTTARFEATKIVEQAKIHSQEQNEISLSRTKKQVETIITQAKEDIASLKEKMVKDIKKESLELIASVTQKVVPELTKTGDQRSLIENRIKEFK